MSPFRRKRWTIAASFGFLLCGGSAQAGGVAESFDPSAAGDAFFSVSSPRAGGHLVPRAKAVFDFAYKPLSVEGLTGDRQSIVSHQVFVHLGASFAMWDRLLLSLDVPFAIAQAGDSPTVAGTKFISPTGADVGDLRLGARGRIFGDDLDAFQVGIGALVFLPTSPSGSYVGESAARFAPQVLAGGRLPFFVYGVSLGPTFHASDHPSTFDIGAGGAFVLGANEFLQAGPELHVSVPFQKDTSFSNAKSNVEPGTATAATLLLAVKLRLLGSLVFGIGGGPGLTKGVGTPVVFAVASVGYEPIAKHEPWHADEPPPDVRRKREPEPDPDFSNRPLPPPRVEEEDALERFDRAARAQCRSGGDPSNLACGVIDKVQACRQNDVDACEVAARVSMASDIDNVRRGSVTPYFLTKACRLAPDRCVAFAITSTRLKDPAVPRSLLEEGCSRSVAVCKQAATMYDEGRSVEEDHAIAKNFAARACAAGDKASCR